MSYLNWSVGSVATQLPGATAILFAHKINFCGDAENTLDNVITRKNLDRELINNELKSIANRKTNVVDYAQLSNVDLIQYILSRFHEVHLEQLPELVRLAARAELVHIEHPLCPKGLAKHLAQLQVDLELHMQKEENILFPLLSAEVEPTLQGPISVMKEEHLNHMQDIETLYELTNEVILHPGACNTWTALYSGLQEFISDINMHIHLENNILFQRES